MGERKSRRDPVDRLDEAKEAVNTTVLTGLKYSPYFGDKKSSPKADTGVAYSPHGDMGDFTPAAGDRK